MINNKKIRRVILDTNIYGLIVERSEEEKIKELIKNAGVFVYGCSVVRNELRDTPKGIKQITPYGIRSLRIMLLNLYDSITINHELSVTEDTQRLAQKYLNRFKELTGQTVVGHLHNDFLLVAVASLNSLDLVISDDHKTLLSIDGVRAYDFVNAEEGLSKMHIITYEEVKKVFKRWSLL